MTATLETFSSSSSVIKSPMARERLLTSANSGLTAAMVAVVDSSRSPPITVALPVALMVPETMPGTKRRISSKSSSSSSTERMLVCMPKPPPPGMPPPPPKPPPPRLPPPPIIMPPPKPPRPPVDEEE